MTTAQVIILIVVIVVVAALAVAGYYYQRRRSLQRRFGPEYERAVSEQDSRGAAEKELLERQRRHAQLDIKDLPHESRVRYATAWEEIQAQFVESPTEAVSAAHELVTQLVAERGYPTENYDDQLSHLSVEHARTLGNYRDAHEIYLRNERGEASTEQLRQAVVHYKELFADLLGEDPISQSRTNAETTPADHPLTTPAEHTDPAQDATHR